MVILHIWTSLFRTLIGGHLSTICIHCRHVDRFCCICNNIRSLHNYVFQLMRRHCPEVLIQCLIDLHDVGTIPLDLAIKLLQVRQCIQLLTGFEGYRCFARPEVETVAKNEVSGLTKSDCNIRKFALVYTMYHSETSFALCLLYLRHLCMLFLKYIIFPFRGPVDMKKFTKMLT